jgi:hypothetical protein
MHLVSQCILLRKWINGNLQLVLTLNLVIFERLGAFSANLLQSYPITQYFFCKVNSAFCFSLCLSCLLIILAFLVFWIDKNADENENQLVKNQLFTYPNEGFSRICEIITCLKFLFFILDYYFYLCFDFNRCFLL